MRETERTSIDEVILTDISLQASNTFTMIEVKHSLL